MKGRLETRMGRVVFLLTFSLSFFINVTVIINYNRVNCHINVESIHPGVFLTQTNVGLETVAGSTVFNMFFIVALVTLSVPGVS